MVNFKIIFIVIHVLSVVFGMGSALVSDFLFNFFSKDRKFDSKELKILEILSRVVWCSLVIIFISGVFIFFSNPSHYMHSTKFLAKMTIFSILLLNGAFLNYYIWPQIVGKKFFQKKKENLRTISFISGAISFISWLYVCALGVLDSVPLGYFDILSFYFIILAFAISFALFIESREFKNKL